MTLVDRPLRKWVLVRNGALVHGLLIISTKTNRSITLEYGDNRGCPLRELHWLDDIGFTQPVEFCGDFLSEGVWNRSGPKKMRVSVGFDMYLDSGALKSSHFKLEVAVRINSG